MNQLLFERSTGALGPKAFARIQTNQLLRSFRPASRICFDGGERSVTGPADERYQNFWAHQAGVKAVAVERFDGRILVSGGSDATIRIWDLEQHANPNLAHTHRPLARIARNADGNSVTGGHRYGITHLCFFPFDSEAFLSSSNDQMLKLWATEPARLSGSFDLGAKIHSHALSGHASHLLVACATQHPAVRLVDLRSASSVQSLVTPGQGANLAVAWSPLHEHVLATGSVDGAVRIWDVRRANGLVGLLDHEDSLGITHNGRGRQVGDATGQLVRERRIRAAVKAHAGPVNGLAWTDDGNYMVSAGHDRRIRVWDAATGANTLVNFGPSIRNGQPASLTMFVSPTGLTPPRGELLFFPNESEILVLDLHKGTTVTRLRGMGSATSMVPGQGGADRRVRNSLTSIAWRGAGGGGGSGGPALGGRNAAGGVFSGHTDGRIRAWMPAIEGRDDEDELDVVADGRALEERAAKRKMLDAAFKNLMGRQIAFA